MILVVLFHLHWLPIKWRFQYKISTMTFKALHNQAPEYIKNLLHPYTPSRGLRSSSKYLLHEPRYNTERYGSRAFQNAAPWVWNSLPINLRRHSNLELFKKDLKTYFFPDSVSPSYINNYHARVSVLVYQLM